MNHKLLFLVLPFLVFIFSCDFLVAGGTSVDTTTATSTSANDSSTLADLEYTAKVVKEINLGSSITQHEASLSATEALPKTSHIYQGNYPNYPDINKDSLIFDESGEASICNNPTEYLEVCYTLYMNSNDFSVDSTTFFKSDSITPTTAIEFQNPTDSSVSISKTSSHFYGSEFESVIQTISTNDMFNLFGVLVSGTGWVEYNTDNFRLNIDSLKISLNLLSLKIEYDLSFMDQKYFVHIEDLATLDFSENSDPTNANIVTGDIINRSNEVVGSMEINNDDGSVTIRDIDGNILGRE